MFLIKNDSWEIRRTQEKGSGVFARKEIKRGVVIGDYLGKVIKTADYDLNNDKKGLYLMYYSDQASIYPNLEKPDIHLVNHSCTPNCWLYIHKGHTLFFARRKIKPGEELTISYLLNPNDGTCNPCPHVCKCGSKKCTGSMHLSKDKYLRWQEFQDDQKGHTRKAKSVFGKNLPKLSSYPEIIPFDSIYEALSS